MGHACVSSHVNGHACPVLHFLFSKSHTTRLFSDHGESETHAQLQAPSKEHDVSLSENLVPPGDVLHNGPPRAQELPITLRNPDIFRATPTTPSKPQPGPSRSFLSKVNGPCHAIEPIPDNERKTMYARESTREKCITSRGLVAVKSPESLAGTSCEVMSSWATPAWAVHLGRRGLIVQFSGPHFLHSPPWIAAVPASNNGVRTLGMHIRILNHTSTYWLRKTMHCWQIVLRPHRTLSC
jgi:hypothetical protein